MASIHNHYHSVYPGNIKIAKPIGTQNLAGLINAIKTPEQKVIDTVELLRTETDPDKRQRLKTTLTGYTPCVLSGFGRKIVDILEFSGLIALDFDKLESVEYATEFRDYLFKEYPFIYATWLSSSGKGVRAIVRIPRVQTKMEFRSYFNGLADKIMNGYIGHDMAPKNPVLPLFQSYDPELKYRETAESWTIKHVQPTPKPIEAYPLYRGTSEQERHVINIVNKAIDKIDDNGHPQLRAIAFALGGYVGAGYIDYYKAIDHINRLIESNSYLSTKSEVYKKTAQEMINKGQRQPLNLPDNG
jgi:hypothetical protein